MLEKVIKIHIDKTGYYFVTRNQINVWK